MAIDPSKLICYKNKKSVGKGFPYKFYGRVFYADDIYQCLQINDVHWPR